MKKINALGFLSLLALLAIFGLTTNNKGMYGFFGFIYYIRYFSVIADELFVQNVQRASMIAFLSEMIGLVPALLISAQFKPVNEAIIFSFAVSFTIALIVFTIALMYFEKRESIREDE